MDLLQNGINDNIEINYLTLEKKFYNASTIWEFEDLREAFASLSGYQSSSIYVNKCNERIKKITDENKELDYGMAETCFNNSKTASDFERCQNLFKALGDYKDSLYYLNECKSQVELLNEDPIYTHRNNSNKSVVSTLNENIHGKSKEETLDLNDPKIRARQRELDMKAAEKKKTAVFTAKLLRTVVLYCINIPCLFFNFLLFIISIIAFEDVDSYAVVLAFGGLALLNLAKLVFCVFSFFGPWIKFEEKVGILNSISNINNGFAQGMARLLAQAVVSYALFVAGTIGVVFIEAFIDFFI